MMYAFSAGWLDIVPTNQPKVQRVPKYQATERLGGQGAMALDMGAEKSVNCYDTALGMLYENVECLRNAVAEV